MNRTILGGDVINVSLIIMGGDYGDINSDDSTCRGYYIIKLSSYPYILQSDLLIDVQVISSSEMLCKGTYYFQSISILVVMFYNKTITRFYL